MGSLVEERRNKILEAIRSRLETIPPASGVNNNVPVEKLILFILDLIRKNNFDGIVTLKIKGSRIFDPRVEETKHLECEYKNID